MLGAQPQDEDFPPDDLDPNLFEFFGFGQPGQGPHPPPDGPSAQFPADQGNQVWAPWPQQNIGQQMKTQGQGQPGLQPILDDAPLLIPIQPVNLEQGIQGNDVAADGLLIPVEEIIQINSPLAEDPPLVEEQPLMPEKIQEEDLLGSINGQENGLENQQQLDNQDNNEQNEYEAQMVQQPILELNQQ